MMKKISTNPSVLLIAFFVVSTLLPQASFAEQDAPLEQVKSLVGQTIEKIKQNKSFEGTELEKRHHFRTALRGIVVEHFDLDTITKGLMGEYWQKANKEQVEDFKNNFLNRVLQVYHNAFQNYTDQEVRFQKKSQPMSNAKQSLVRTLLILEDDTRIPINYYLVERSKGWLVYDIHIDGVGLINTYRNAFQRQFQSKPINQVIEEFRLSNEKV